MRQHASTGQTSVVGRTRELEALRKLLEDARRGEGGFVLLDGEAGIGKTALVEALKSESRQLGMAAATGYAYDMSESTPYSVWLDLIRTYGDSSGTLVDGSIFAPAETGTGQEAYLNQLARSILDAAGSQPMLLILEDLHWADVASLELLRVIARRSRETPTLTIGTYRSDQLNPRDPLFQLLPTIVREARAERISLRPLDRSEIAEYLRVRHQIEVDTSHALISYLVEHSDGNPLFLSELVRSLLMDEVLHQRDDAWIFDPATDISVPPLVQQLISTRLSALSPDTREMLDAASVVGQIVPYDVLQAVLGWEVSRLARAIRDSLEAYVLHQPAHHEHLEFTHALVRDVLYEALVIPERRTLHREVAEYWLSSPANDPDIIASHLLRAKDDRAVEWLIRAGDRSQRAYALRTAAQRFQSALEILGEPREPSRTYGWLLYRTARLMRFSNPGGAIDLLNRAGEEGKRRRDEVLEAYAVADRGLMHCFDGSIRAGIQDIEEGSKRLADLAEQCVVLDPDVAFWIHDQPAPTEAGDLPSESLPDSGELVSYRWGTQVHWLATAGYLDRAMELGQRYLETYRSWPAGIVSGLGFVHAALAEPELARQYLSRARDLTAAANNHVLTGLHAATQLVDVELRYFPDDLTTRRRFQELAETTRSRANKALPSSEPVRCSVTPALFLEGEWQEAGQYARIEAARGLTENRLRAEVVLIRIAIARGQYDRGWARILRLLPDGPDTEPGDINILVGLELQRLAAQLCLDKRDLVTAGAWLDAHGRWREWSGARAGSADEAALRARLHRIDGDLATAELFAREAQSLAGQPRQPTVLYSVHREFGKQAAERDDLDAAREHVQQAVEIAVSCAAPYLHGLALIDRAVIERALRDTNAAAGSLAGALELLDPLEALPAIERAREVAALLPDHVAGSWSPSEAAPQPSTTGLTERETEVLQLLASGMSNRELAAALDLSIRTIERHVSNIYFKIDAHNRVDATAFAIRHDIV